VKHALRSNNLGLFFFYDRGGRENRFVKIAHSDVFDYMRDVEFKDDSTSNGSNSKMLPSGRNQAFMVVEVTESPKSPSLDFGEDIEKREEEQVEDNLVGIQAPKERPTNKWCSSTPPPQNNFIEGMQLRLGIDDEGHPLEKQRYLIKVHRVFGEW
jgi:hypothetical protein